MSRTRPACTHVTKRVALLSAACGIAWHTLITLLLGRSLLDALSWRLLPGIAAGLAAGMFTIWSRTRRGGRESVWDVIATYYLAVAVYIVAGVPLVIFERDLHLGQLLGAVVGALYYAAIVATLLGVVLIPLCFATRHLLWRLRGTGVVQIEPSADGIPDARPSLRSPE